ncbi:hypothetical protein RHSIM_RhsimUnG0064600 [Rhododendron simsii]|uniref:Serpin domain-containing protein n=1 Tax=Rhododendron simsii TaxID=118357 RepID=A0A834L5D7_RHOSS|nr:hypothetical protein RHSIM_RhsimUnG0064600 [Rhododendron simsii]
MEDMGEPLTFLENPKDWSDMMHIPEGVPFMTTKMIQKACIEVDEKGTEAAAVTVLMMVPGAAMHTPPPETASFVADHPFMFMIKEETSGSVFFTGAVVNPRYWPCTATEASIKIWVLESKMVVVDLKVDAKEEAEMNEGSATQSPGVENKVIHNTSLSWSADGSTLFSGYTDGIIRVWGIDSCCKPSRSAGIVPGRLPRLCLCLVNGNVEAHSHSMHVDFT